MNPMYVNVTHRVCYITVYCIRVPLSQNNEYHMIVYTTNNMEHPYKQRHGIKFIQNVLHIRYPCAGYMYTTVTHAAIMHALCTRYPCIYHVSTRYKVSCFYTYMYGR